MLRRVLLLLPWVREACCAEYSPLSHGWERHAAQSVLLSPVFNSLFTVGHHSSLPSLIPVSLLVNAPAPAPLPSRFTVGQCCPLLFPVSLLVNTLHTVNTRFTVGNTHVPGRLIPHNVLKPENLPRTKVSLR